MQPSSAYSQLMLASATLLLIFRPSAAQLTSSSQLVCPQGYQPGNDTVAHTFPYTYLQVLSIIGSFKNLTWAGNPIDTVSLNGTDNTVGTARTYDLQDMHIVETLLTYESPTSGPFVEVHDLATINSTTYNVSVAAPFDGTTLTSTCDGRASIMNMTTLFCATNVSTASAIFHSTHAKQMAGAGVLLGNASFTACDALTGGASGSLGGDLTIMGLILTIVWLLAFVPLD